MPILLKEIDQVLEIKMRENSHDDGNRSMPHSHSISMECNRIVGGETSLDQEMIRKLEEVLGDMILRPQVSFYQ